MKVFEMTLLSMAGSKVVYILAVDIREAVVKAYEVMAKGDYRPYTRLIKVSEIGEEFE